MNLLHICEACDKQEVLDSNVAFNNGWDYPPHMGIFGVLSPRTCPDCGFQDTLWWRVMHDQVTEETLTERDRIFLERVLNEPESILV